MDKTGKDRPRLVVRRGGKLEVLKRECLAIWNTLEKSSKVKIGKHSLDLVTGEVVNPLVQTGHVFDIYITVPTKPRFPC